MIAAVTASIPPGTGRALLHASTLDQHASAAITAAMRARLIPLSVAHRLIRRYTWPRSPFQPRVINAHPASAENPRMLELTTTARKSNAIEWAIWTFAILAPA